MSESEYCSLVSHIEQNLGDASDMTINDDGWFVDGQHHIPRNSISLQDFLNVKKLHTRKEGLLHLLKHRILGSSSSLNLNIYGNAFELILLLQKIISVRYEIDSIFQICIANVHAGSRLTK